MSAGKFIAGFIVGGTVGAIIGILLAPQSGEETRGAIGNKTKEAYDKAQGAVKEIQAKADDVVSEMQKKGEEIIAKIQDLINKKEQEAKAE